MGNQIATKWSSYGMDTLRKDLEEEVILDDVGIDIENEEAFI